MEQKKFFQKMLLENWGIQMWKNMSLNTRAYTLHKTSLQMDHRPSYPCKAVKFLEDNKGKHLGDLECGDAILETTPKTSSMEEIIDKLGFI